MTAPAEPSAGAPSAAGPPAGVPGIAAGGRGGPAGRDPDPADRPPVAALFADVVGQPRTVAFLRSAARRPVHAYLFHGPPGSGKREAAQAFAAALLCPEGGCGDCSTCRQVLSGVHPDVVMVDRAGASVSVDEARQVVGLVQRRPAVASRQVVVLSDVHLAGHSAPALLKTVEEPPPATVVILLADEMPAELDTLASRCVRVPFGPVAPDVLRDWLIGHGVAEETAAWVAEASNGRRDRALLLASDDAFIERLSRWRTLPERLDGTGAVVAAEVAELLGAIDASLGPLRERHAAELEQLAARATSLGQRGGSGRKEAEERHKREERRWRTDEIRAGLAALAGAERDRLASLAAGARPGATRSGREAVAAVDAIGAAASALARNPNEALLLQDLFLRLVPGDGTA